MNVRTYVCMYPSIQFLPNEPIFTNIMPQPLQNLPYHKNKGISLYVLSVIFPCQSHLESQMIIIITMCLIKVTNVGKTIKTIDRIGLLHIGLFTLCSTDMTCQQTRLRGMYAKMKFWSVSHNTSGSYIFEDSYLWSGHRPGTGPTALYPLSLAHLDDHSNGFEILYLHA